MSLLSPAPSPPPPSTVTTPPPPSPNGIALTLEPATDLVTLLVRSPFNVITHRQQLAHTWRHLTTTPATQLPNLPHTFAPPPNLVAVNGRLAFKAIYQYEGLSALYKGNFTMYLNRSMTQSISTLTKFIAIAAVIDTQREQQQQPPLSTAEILAHTLKSNTAMHQLNLPYYYGAAAVAASAIISYPLDVVSTRLAANPATHPAKQRPLPLRTVQFFPTIRAVLRESMTTLHGTRSITQLYSGVTPYIVQRCCTLLPPLLMVQVTGKTREVVTNVKQQLADIPKSLQNGVSIDDVQKQVDDLKQQLVDQEAQWYPKMAALVLSAPLLAVVQYPFATISRSMRVHGMLTQVTANQTSVTYQAQHYTSVRHAVSSIYRHGGLRGFFRGFATHACAIVVSGVLLAGTAMYMRPVFTVVLQANDESDEAEDDDIDDGDVE